MENQNKLIAKVNNIDEALNSLSTNIDPNSIDRKAIRIINEYENMDETKKNKFASENLQLLDEFVRIHEFEKHVLLAESLPVKYASLSIKMTQSLIKEHSCTSTIEKSLAEVIVNSFCRSLYLSKLIVGALSHDSIPIEQNFVNYYNYLGKELDRANREYLTALTTLQQLKSPRLNVNLKAGTAIVGQNQQFNSITDSKNETNKAN